MVRGTGVGRQRNGFTGWLKGKTLNTDESQAAWPARGIRDVLREAEDWEESSGITNVCTIQLAA